MTISLRWTALLIIVVSSASFFLFVLIFPTAESENIRGDIQSRVTRSDTSRGGGNAISCGDVEQGSKSTQHIPTSNSSNLDDKGDSAPGTILHQATNYSSQASSVKDSPGSITGDQNSISSRTFSPDRIVNQLKPNTPSSLFPVNGADSKIHEIGTSELVSARAKPLEVTAESTGHSTAITGSPLRNQVNVMMGGGDRAQLSVGRGDAASTVEYPEVETPQQFQTQFGDSAYSKAVTERLAEESNLGKP